MWFYISEKCLRSTPLIILCCPLSLVQHLHRSLSPLLLLTPAIFVSLFFSISYSVFLFSLSVLLHHSHFHRPQVTYSHDMIESSQTPPLPHLYILKKCNRTNYHPRKLTCGLWAILLNGAKNGIKGTKHD